GCGRSGSGKQTAAGASGSAGTTLQPQKGGYLQHMLPYSVANLDPATTEDATGYGFVETDWYDLLVRIQYTPNPDWRILNKVIPSLAERFEQVDKTTYTFSVRQGVKFHNGDALSAQDVVYSYSRIKDPALKPNPSVVRYLDNIDKAEATDPYTVRLTTKRPDADFLANISYRYACIVSKRFVENGGDLTKTVVGTGPFKLSSYQRDSTALAVRNPDSWLPSGSYLDGIKLVLKVDDSTMSAAFATGDVDILIRHDRKQADPILKANPKALTQNAPADQVYGVTFNQTKPPFSDLRVRQAVHLAIDRQAADQATNFGEGVICGPLVVVGKTGWHIPVDEMLKLPGYRQPKAQDVTEAKRLLAGAGFASGFKTTLGFSSATESQSAYAEVVQAQLKQIGIDASLQPWDNATYTQHRAKPDHDMVIVSEGSFSSPGSVAYASFYSSGVFAKPTGVNDPDLDKLIDSQAVEFDFDKRGTIFQQIERWILDKAYKAPISTPKLVRLNQPWVHDWVDSKNNRATVMNPDAVWMSADQAPASRRQV
ncbi:MAG TPA: ABC transporter substrate-binding protein, partial [Dehalococcoidia bacterium]|nr:ABC transporter substrate-binding protein [Dehalococcoidia bacterium]